MNLDARDLFRRIPAVDKLLLQPKIRQALEAHPRNLVMRAIHDVLAEIRETIRTGDPETAAAGLEIEAVSGRILVHLERLAQPRLRPLINATGVVVHTNLGRSPLAAQVLARLGEVGTGYSNLEFDLQAGRRGSRYAHVEGILRELTGAEAAMVVNNNAAAVLLALETLAQDREVIVSRGQLVEIGGSFRIPDVMRKSGARMVEVGTTNKTHLKDYEQALGPATALLLKVHTSNFQVVGFTQEVSTAELAALGRRHGIPVMEDLGSGCLVDFGDYGLLKEPTVQEALQSGADLITFSGDKLLGGPQAGILLGRKDLIDAVKGNQLARALRIDKLTLVALEETLRLYRDPSTAPVQIPTLNMLLQPYAAMRRKALRLKRMVGALDRRNFRLELIDGTSRPGGGALPLLELPTRLLCLVPASVPAHEMEAWLRRHDPPIIARLDKERVLLDVRTIGDSELRTVARALRSLAALRLERGADKPGPAL